MKPRFPRLDEVLGIHIDQITRYGGVASGARTKAEAAVFIARHSRPVTDD